jgi:WD40 repeat protein
MHPLISPLPLNLIILDKGITVKTLKGHSREVFSLNYNSTSTLLVSGGCDGDVRIWNVAKGMQKPYNVLSTLNIQAQGNASRLCTHI